MLGDLVNLIVAKGFEKLPKVQKSPDLVTLSRRDIWNKNNLSFSMVGGGTMTWVVWCFNLHKHMGNGFAPEK